MITWIALLLSTASLLEGVHVKNDSLKELNPGSVLVPRFISRGQTFRVVLGDTLVLPCEVQNLGPFVVLWRRGSTVLTAAKIMIVRDSRFRLVDGFNLEISNVMPQDAGDYTCQLSDGNNNDLVHTVEILVPPSIRTFPSGGQLTARKGGSITLECKASGNPVPVIYWSRKDNPLPSREKPVEGFSITLDKVDRHHAGIYQCTASNGVGDPVTVDTQLDVLYAPEITVEKNTVRTGERSNAQLICVIHGEPQPEVTWYQDSFAVENTDRRIMEKLGNKYVMNVINVRSSDFGNYSCQAENSIGRSKSHIELTGKPATAKFQRPTTSRSMDSYNLTWVIESSAPLEEVRLLYRRIEMNDSDQVNSGQWQDVVIHASSRGEPRSTHVMSFNLRDLEPASVYEVIIQAKNKYGWSDVSDIYQFRTHNTNEIEINEPDMKESELTRSASLASTISSCSRSHTLCTTFLFLLLFYLTGDE